MVPASPVRFPPGAISAERASQTPPSASSPGQVDGRFHLQRANQGYLRSNQRRHQTTQAPASDQHAPSALRLRSTQHIGSVTDDLPQHCQVRCQV
jgi:hypothetical protein